MRKYRAPYSRQPVDARRLQFLAPHQPWQVADHAHGVAHEQAPFDRPEIFLPISGSSAENRQGRSRLLASSPTFRRLLPVGVAGHPERLPAFMNISSTPVPGTDNDQFDQ